MAASCIENNRKTRGIKVDVAGRIYKRSKAPIRNNKGIRKLSTYVIGKSIVAKFCRGWGNTLVYAFLCHPLERRQPVLPGRWLLSSLPEEFPAAAHSPSMASG